MYKTLIFIWSILMVLSHPAAAEVAIAPRDVALTFARVGSPGAYQLMLVSSYANGRVSGINLSDGFGADADDPITLFAAQGYDALIAAQGAELDVAVEDLTLPVDLTASHIAVGTNFPAHAEEATVEDGPFLFAKEVVPTAFNAPVSQGVALLDYEVELCFVALEDFDITSRPRSAGLVLCNDVTDRAKLMRHLNPSDVTSGDGFTTGKSAPGYLPIGNLFVIPRNLRSFAPEVDLMLYRGSDLVQSAKQSLAIWDFDEILRQSADRADITWDYEGRQVGLPIANGVVPARTGVLAGTPDGTVFKGIDRMAMVMGVVDWLMGGWNKPLTHWVIERHIAGAMAQGNYLQPGETMTITADYLGELVNPIVE
ncbi:Fumarylacetoacetate hydrolase family protein [Candidatus Phaeomarinobacter ectocarpi]|uniref:Fumarylacetoacetate hydrolase family protein n=1 Tax=Candidatus Phaeomarinibacter ectocarpi TaxID=1458461 RepID=X5MNP7_9HYPH|nr:fumarylacetoacetate hydrolase family protein [Candidatus Phaeomarinobacter ectocarpi]CDO60286.1 Fumarylacetoacetate hydrolase family protein [Candidatus Phaeomarinobacter ectocarpi]